jgi:hypothetical protein
MSDITKLTRAELDWNVLTSKWIEVMTLNGEAEVYSPLEALNRASEIRCIALPSPLDLFAAHRFLLTLLYWKADASGGVQQVRESLLRGKITRVVLDAIEREAHCFRMFDEKSPFLQDPSARDAKKPYSPGSLFAEFASGTNIAHFHHGDDDKMRLCVRCATIGMLRVVPWTQSGGAGLTPSVHNAPPIVAIAFGPSLAITLGLNFVPLSGEAGKPKWTGRFAPTKKDAAIPYLEALTWNPRRVHLCSPQADSVCWGCGRSGIATVGPIVYLKNEETKKRSDKKLFEWNDPAAFYAADADDRYRTMKSTDEELAATGRDLRRLLNDDPAPKATVVTQNPDHKAWILVVPCTDPANKKTFDHRQLDLTGCLPDSIRSEIPVYEPPKAPQGLDGWTEPPHAHSRGATRFVQAAARLLTAADWTEVSNAAYKDVQDSPAAFDVLSGLLWGLRRTGVRLPSWNVAWLVLKLMATVPARARAPRANASFCPLASLPKRQVKERRNDRATLSPYPLSLPRGRRLEAELRAALERNTRHRKPKHVDWTALCHGLDQLLD